MSNKNQQNPVDEVTTSDDIRDDLSVGRCILTPLDNPQASHYAVFAGGAEGGKPDSIVALTGVVGDGDDANSVKYARFFAAAPRLAASGATLAFVLRGLIEATKIDPQTSHIAIPDQPNATLSVADALEHFDAVFAAAHNIKRGSLALAPLPEPTVAVDAEPTVQ